MKVKFSPEKLDAFQFGVGNKNPKWLNTAVKNGRVKIETSNSGWGVTGREERSYLSFATEQNYSGLVYSGDWILSYKRNGKRFFMAVKDKDFKLFYKEIK